MPADAAAAAHAEPRPPLSPPPESPVSRPRRGRFSPVWIIPLVALGLGLWLVLRYYSAKGPEITVTFETAEGIIAGKTPVLCRSVNVGTVVAVRLGEDLKHVVITLDMVRDATRLLLDDAQMFVVRARFSSAGVTGLNTIVSGNYLELLPGTHGAARRQFIGLENPPVTPPGVPGLRFRLVAEQAGGLGPGASIIFKGINVGKIESRTFHPDTGEVEFDAFMDREYAGLVSQRTRFYNYGGVDLKIGAEGVRLRSGTLESLLTGGVTFTDPSLNGPNAQPVRNGATFTLFASFDDATRTEISPTVPYLLLFTGSVRGLSQDAPGRVPRHPRGHRPGRFLQVFPGRPRAPGAGVHQD